jgi:hypothetical protein
MVIQGVHLRPFVDLLYPAWTILLTEAVPVEYQAPGSAALLYTALHRDRYHTKHASPDQLLHYYDERCSITLCHWHRYEGIQVASRCVYPTYRSYSLFLRYSTLKNSTWMTPNHQSYYISSNKQYTLTVSYVRQCSNSCPQSPLQPRGKGRSATRRRLRRFNWC